jgi:hypothetical protein
VNIWISVGRRSWRMDKVSKRGNLEFIIFITRMMKLKNMSWAEHVTHRGEMSNAYRDLVGNSSEKKQL